MPEHAGKLQEAAELCIKKLMPEHAGKLQES
jgi:hypothetical protein